LGCRLKYPPRGGGLDVVTGVVVVVELGVAVVVVDADVDA
jgi:hypothetical protein